MVTQAPSKKIYKTSAYKSYKVQKIDFQNHVLRNYCNKLIAITTNTKLNLKRRKLLKRLSLQFKYTMRKATEFRKKGNCKSNAIKLVRKDIINSVADIFKNTLNMPNIFIRKKLTAEMFTGNYPIFHTVVRFIDYNSKTVLKMLIAILQKITIPYWQSSQVICIH